MSRTLEQAIEVLVNQEAKGIKKYGGTLDQTRLDLKGVLEMLRHRQQEIADDLMYTTRAIALLENILYNNLQTQPVSHLEDKQDFQAACLAYEVLALMHRSDKTLGPTLDRLADLIESYEDKAYPDWNKEDV